jgi:hypothetical protein
LVESTQHYVMVSFIPAIFAYCVIKAVDRLLPKRSSHP